MAAPLLYARVVASFSADVAPAAVDAVIELARRLGAELQAVLLEDLVALGDLPSLRAFDPRGAVWREVQRVELQQEIDRAAAALDRQLQAARAAGVPARVAVSRERSRATLQRLAQAGDLLVVSEPADPVARWVQPFAGLLDAALAAPVPLLYLPQRGARSAGPVAALGDGIGAVVARRLAQALGVGLFEPDAETVARAPLLAAWLPQLRERKARVVVCARAALGADAARTLQQAGDFRIAVLLLEPGAAG